MKPSWVIIALALVSGFAVGCGVSQEAEDGDRTAVATGAQTAGIPHVCEVQTTFGKQVRLFSTKATVVLRADYPVQDIGDPSLFASVQKSRTIVFKTTDFSAVKQVLRSDVRVWDALLDDVREVPDPAVDRFRATVADTFVSNLQCDDGEAPAASTDTATPFCTNGAANSAGSAQPSLIIIAKGPDGSGFPQSPEQRYTFDVKYEPPPTAWAASSSSSSTTTSMFHPTITSAKKLRMNHLSRGMAGVASMRQALLTSELNLARDFLGDSQIYRDLDPTLSCPNELPP